jgi:hypothetical protein
MSAFPYGDRLDSQDTGTDSREPGFDKYQTPTPKRGQQVVSGDPALVISEASRDQFLAIGNITDQWDVPRMDVFAMRGNACIHFDHATPTAALVAYHIAFRHGLCTEMAFNFPPDPIPFTQE